MNQVGAYLMLELPSLIHQPNLVSRPSSASS